MNGKQLNQYQQNAMTSHLKSMNIKKIPRHMTLKI